MQVLTICRAGKPAGYYRELHEESIRLGASLQNYDYKRIPDWKT
jgi:hypothetical protein